jgi:hypothetical protein
MQNSNPKQTNEMKWKKYMNRMNRKAIVTCCTCLIIYIGCSLLPNHSEFDDKATLEDVMEMEIPNYKIKKYISDSHIDFHGDFCDSIIVEFEKIPSKRFIDKVNQRVAADAKKREYKRWLKHGKHQYRFQACYGDGGRTPKCREGKHDWAICLNFSDNSKKGVIEYWYW